MGFNAARQARHKRHQVKRAMNALALYAPSTNLAAAQSAMNTLQEVEDREVMDGLQAAMLANPSSAVDVIAANIRFFRNREIR